MLIGVEMKQQQHVVLYTCGDVLVYYFDYIRSCRWRDKMNRVLFKLNKKKSVGVVKIRWNKKKLLLRKNDQIKPCVYVCAI